MIDKKRRRMFVKPAEGLRVRMHHNPRAFLPDSGAWVPMSVEWMRALADGDVALPPAPKPAKKTAKKTAKKEG